MAVKKMYDELLKEQKSKRNKVRNKSRMKVKNTLKTNRVWMRNQTGRVE